jgi:hypothetical protein
MRILSPGRRPHRLRALATGSAVLAGLAVGGGLTATTAKAATTEASASKLATTTAATDDQPPTARRLPGKLPASRPSFPDTGRERLPYCLEADQPSRPERPRTTLDILTRYPPWHGSPRPEGLHLLRQQHGHSRALPQGGRPARQRPREHHRPPGPVHDSPSSPFQRPAELPFDVPAEVPESPGIDHPVVGPAPWAGHCGLCSELGPGDSEGAAA